MSSKKLTFILFNINPNEIDKKYNINIKSNIDSTNTIINKTNLADLTSSNHKHVIYFDEAKKKKKSSVTMLHHITNSIISKKTNLRCFWCKHNFKTQPIGCPIKINEKQQYICDGIFCSFNCCMSFIIDNQHNPFYEYSLHLLYNIYKSISNNNNKIEPAPSWRLIDVFGGHLTISQFRDSFYKVEYIDSDTKLQDLPTLLPIGYVYEERIKI